MIQEGLTPPVPGDKDDTKVRVKSVPTGRHFSRERVQLNEEQTNKIKMLLANVWDEWMANTSLLKSKLQRYNNIMEGIKEPKIFPWVNSSNLHIPLIEIHITILHSVASSTMLEMDPIWYVKPVQDGVPEGVDTDLENFLNSKSRIEVKVDSVLSDIFWNTYRDGLGIGALDWVEEYGKQYDQMIFKTPEEFQEAFPTPEDAGVSEKEYQELMKELINEGELGVKVEETLTTYRGPKLRIVELKDLIVIPTTSPSFDYAMFVGDAFLERADYFRRMVKNDKWFDKDEVEKVIAQPGLVQAPDVVTQSQDQIEGLGRTRNTKPDEYYCMQGVLKYDLDDDGIEEKFLIVFHPETKALLRMERFPYWHNKCNYIEWRFKKRPKRLLGQSIPDQLIDINEEVDTQHNQRIDSRTITTVPSFLKLEGADFDPSRKDQRFYPGVTFKVANFNVVKQFDIKQTDLGTSLQEEQNLFLVADTRTGASQLRSGREVARDPRAPAKKVAMMLQQSTQRIDDHLRELKYGTEELGYQMLELYYQYSPETIPYPKFNQETQAYVMGQVKRAKLRARNMFLQVSRTSVMDNPTQLIQRYMTMYSLLSKEPLVGNNLLRRRELVYRLLTALRERDPEKIIPKVDQLLKEMAQQNGLNDESMPQNIRDMMAGIGGNSGKREGPRDTGLQKPVDTSGGNPAGEG